MGLEFQKQYDPELDVCNLLHFYFCSEQPKAPAATALEQLSSERGIPLETLREIAAPAIELEDHILGRLSVPEERMRYYFPPAEQQDGAIGLPLCWFYKRGIRFRELSGEERRLYRTWLLKNISNIGVDELAGADDPGALFQLLHRYGCTDHTIRVCLEVFLDPAHCQEDFEEILLEATGLYREKMDLLPPVEDCTFHTFFQKWQDDGESLRTLDSSLPRDVAITAYPTPFLFFCREAILFYLPGDGARIQILSGIWDDRISELIDQPEFSVTTLAMELKAISDKRRLELLGALGEGEQTVDALCSRFSLSPALLSYHLDQLYRVNLITLKRSGRSNLYSLNQQHMSVLLNNLGRHLHLSEAHPESAP